MKLKDLGYDNFFEDSVKRKNIDSMHLARIISEHKERYIICNEEGYKEAEITGNLKYSANDSYDFPAVGDWVVISKYDENKAVIHEVLARKNHFERKAVGKYADRQIIAANIDFALIVQAVDRDHNLNRIERYLSVCNECKIKPIILLNKTDLIDNNILDKLVNQTKQRISNIPIITASNEEQNGLNSLKSKLIKGKTYCLIGSSGVGKSSLLNNLSGKSLMKTECISSSTKKGKHITVHRQLFVLESGVIIIDNPGMREFGMTDNNDGLDITYSSFREYSKKCKFKNCSHINEPDCAVKEAISKNELSLESYENYLKLLKEQKHFETDLREKKKNEKALGKIIKEYKNIKKKNNI